MKRFWIGRAVLAFFVIFVEAGPAFACSCVGGSVKDDFRGANAVFTGRVTKIEVVDPMPNGHDRTMIVSFQVSAFWKGVSSQPVMVKTHTLGSNCGFPFQVGQEYLVFAAKTKILGEPSVGLETMACTGLNELPGANSIVKQLGRPKVPPIVR